MKQIRSKPPHRRFERTALATLIFSSGMTADFIAFKAGVAPSIVSGAASGSAVPSDAALAKLAEVLGVSHPHDLLRSIPTSELDAALRAYIDV